MTKFTKSEANLSLIKIAEFVSCDENYHYWKFEINDADGNYYNWTDNQLSIFSTSKELKNAIFIHLTTIEEKIPKYAVWKTYVKTEIIDSIVG